ncbi:MAG: hypothetical protein R2780_04525 [Crocinitomicaceae bacterium]|nr:hypothetical protein [Crocinitomicaceae bacterium]
MRTSFYLLLPAFLFISCSGSTEDNTDAHEGNNDTISEIIPEAEIDIHLTLCDNIPHACKFEGSVVDAYTWKDLNGTNYIIRTIGEVMEGEAQYSDMEAHTQWLYAYHFIEDAKGNVTLSREIKDYVENCEFDLNMGHELDALTVTDLDEDQIGEITFIYRLNCTSDVSPSDQKLMMLENGDKYALRGITQVMGDGGTYEIDKAFDNAPAAFLDHAKKLWGDNLTEYDFEL